MTQKSFNNLVDAIRQIADWTYEESEGADVIRFDLDDASIWVYRNSLEGNIPVRLEEKVNKIATEHIVNNYVSFY